MAILQVITAPDPVLRQISLTVESVNDQIRHLMDDMLETIYHDDGVGLAAIQIGIPKRVIVIDLQNDDETKRPKGFYPLFIANPEITKKSNELVLGLEGCLSLPEQRIEVARPDAITIKFLDYHNNLKTLGVDGWLARAIQHEIDHLDGKLLIDYLSHIKRDSALRKLKKLKKYCL